MINWETYKFRASAIHKLIIEPQTKAAKEAGELSQTAKSYLKELYIEAVWGLSRDLQNKYCDKGRMVEQDMITLLSRMDKTFYLKNEERIEDQFFSGIPDIFSGKSIKTADYIIDGKSSWSPWTFIAKLGEKLEKEWWCQLQIYLELCNCQRGEISVCLLNTPDTIIEDEKRRALYNMGGGTEESDEFKLLAEEIELSSRFDHIPLAQRRIRFPVERDPEFIKLAQEKVAKGRQYLQFLYDTHYLSVT